VTGDVTAYTVAKFLHVMLAMVWVGGALMLQVFARSALASGVPGRIADLSRDMEAVGKRLFTPLSLLVLLLGLYLVEEGGWGFGSFWISFAMLGILVSVVNGAGYLGPQTAKLNRMIGAEGDAPAVREKMATILRVARMEIALLVFIVFLMVTKLGD